MGKHSMESARNVRKPRRFLPAAAPYSSFIADINSTTTGDSGPSAGMVPGFGHSIAGIGSTALGTESDGPYPDVTSQVSMEPAAPHPNAGAPVSEHDILNGIAGTRGAGERLEPHPRQQLEDWLGASLSDVRIHTGADANRLAGAVDAVAFTTGRDIFFRSGSYDPHTRQGMELLAHETIHTLQQGVGSDSATSAASAIAVSDPSDAFESEASAMSQRFIQGGAPPQHDFGRISVSSPTGASIQRQPVTTGGLGGLTVVPTASGPDPNPFRLPTSTEPPTLNLWNPNADAYGVVYDVPAKDYRADLMPATPPLDAPMPEAKIPVPDKMPGWKTPVPPTVVTAPTGEKFEFPGNPDYIVTRHSTMMTSAWDAYRFHLIPALQDAWNNARGKIDSYTQQKKGDPTLDATVKDMQKRWNIDLKTGKGTVSAQGGKIGVDRGTSVAKINADVAAAEGDKDSTFMRGLQATGAKMPGDTEGTPVQQAVTALQAAKDHSAAHLEKCKGTAIQLDGAADDLKAAQIGLEVRDLEGTKEEQEKKKAEIESGQAGLKKLGVGLDGLIPAIKKYSAPLKSLTSAAKGAASAAEGDLGGGLEAAKGVMEVIKWSEVQKMEDAINTTNEQIKDKLKQQAWAAYSGAFATVRGLTQEMAAMAKDAEANFLAEKTAYENLANVVRSTSNWKGENKEDAELAAKALKAVPVVEKLIRFLEDVRAGLPKLPDGTFNADKAYTLAKDGVNAPGVADLLRVGGWLAGIQEQLQSELQMWQVMLGHLQMVATQLGVQ